MNLKTLADNVILEAGVINDPKYVHDGLLAAFLMGAELQRATMTSKLTGLIPAGSMAARILDNIEIVKPPEEHTVCPLCGRKDGTCDKS